MDLRRYADGTRKLPKSMALRLMREVQVALMQKAVPMKRMWLDDTLGEGKQWCACVAFAGSERACIFEPRSVIKRGVAQIVDVVEKAYRGEDLQKAPQE